jgi:hypothetical protein
MRVRVIKVKPVDKVRVWPITRPGRGSYDVRRKVMYKTGTTGMPDNQRMICSVTHITPLNIV